MFANILKKSKQINPEAPDMLRKKEIRKGIRNKFNYIQNITKIKRNNRKEYIEN
jgi:hypothetical protein